MTYRDPTTGRFARDPKRYIEAVEPGTELTKFLHHFVTHKTPRRKRAARKSDGTARARTG